MNRLAWWTVAAAFAGIAAFAACGGGEDSQRPEPPAREAPSAPQPAAPPAAGNPTEVTEASRAAALEIFSTRCMTCHGPEGAGDGPGSIALVPKPRNFQEASWQDSVSDEHIEMIIQYGGAAVGKSPTMPSNPDLSSKPDVVAALREHIRSLGSN